MKGKHSLKLGGEYLHTLHGGAFPQYLRGGLTCTSCRRTSARALYNTFFPKGTLDPTSWNYAAINAYCDRGADLHPGLRQLRHQHRPQHHRRLGAG